jgi:hypothetical protein
MSGSGVVTLRKSADFGQSFSNAGMLASDYNWFRPVGLDAPWYWTPDDGLLLLTHGHLHRSTDQGGSFSLKLSQGQGPANMLKRPLTAYVTNPTTVPP